MAAWKFNNKEQRGYTTDAPNSRCEEVTRDLCAGRTDVALQVTVENTGAEELFVTLE